jgi:hypothetical protein
VDLNRSVDRKRKSAVMELVAYKAIDGSMICRFAACNRAR